MRESDAELPLCFRYIGVDGTLDPERPGNGGMRVMNYEHADAAVDEVSVLATTMTAKHSVFNTGFGGAKLVLHAHGDITVWFCRFACCDILLTFVFLLELISWNQDQR